MTDDIEDIDLPDTDEVEEEPPLVDNDPVPTDTPDEETP